MSYRTQGTSSGTSGIKFIVGTALAAALVAAGIYLLASSPGTTTKHKQPKRDLRSSGKVPRSEKTSSKLSKSGELSNPEPVRITKPKGPIIDSTLAVWVDIAKDHHRRREIADAIYWANKAIESAKDDRHFKESINYFHLLSILAKDPSITEEQRIVKLQEYGLY